jgi:uncharacterized membrane protein
MNSLENSLAGFSTKDKDEIIYDYEEHFSIGLESGKSEDEICRELGDPDTIAKQYKISSTIERASAYPSTGNIFRAVIASIGLGLMNLIFVLGPFLAAAGVLFGLWIASCSIILAGLVTTFSTVLSSIFPGFIFLPGFIPSIALVLYGIGLTALGLLLFMGFSYISKQFLKGTVKYLKMNVNIIIGRR